MVTELKGRKLGDFTKNNEFSKQKDQCWNFDEKNEKQNISYALSLYY